MSIVRSPSKCLFCALARCEARWTSRCPTPGAAVQGVAVARVVPARRRFSGIIVRHGLRAARSMPLFLIRRLATFVLTLWVASVVVFAVMELLPGNAAQVMLGDTATPEAIAALERKFGLDRPPIERYTSWVGGLLGGHSQTSFAYDVPVAELVAERLQVSLPLALLAMALTVVVALALGLYAASHHNRAGDIGVMTLSQLGLAVPNFWLAILLILVFAVQLQWVSAGGFPGWRTDEGGGLWAGLSSLLLPALALAAVQAAILARVTRSALLDVMREDYVRTARAKGLTARQALWRHALRNAMIPVVTIMGLQFANLITGTIVVENVFVLPGIGRLVFQAIANRDIIVVRDVVMLLAAVVVVVNLAVDVAVALIDPRLRLQPQR
jgi:peptide/nickel transport system permease protein